MAASSSTKAHTALAEVDKDGNFQRTASAFQSIIEPGGRFAPEANRYHLYVALGCPWAAGTLAALKHKGLDTIVGHSIVHPTWAKTRPDDESDAHCGWQFKNPGDSPVPNPLGHGSFECDDALVPDTVNGCKSIRELYDLAGDTTGKYTTPVLWDKKEKTIVNNESLNILGMFDTAFGDLAGHPDRCLFPPELEATAEEWNDLIYPSVNNGVYRCGFATTQGAYEKAHEELFSALDSLEAHRAEQKESNTQTKYWMTDDQPTWLDIRLYMTLVRFDPVYVVYFKTSAKTIGNDYPHLLEYMRTCYRSVPAIREATNLRHIKMHYFTSHPSLNPYGIIPVSDGPSLEHDGEEE